MTHLHLHRLSFTHAGASEPLFTALSLTLQAGWTGIVGANGTGKSTLLRLLTGDLAPDGGQILAPPGGLYCPQRTDAAPGELGALLQAREAPALRLRSQLGIQPDWEDRWTTLSHGERKRAQLAVALWQDPPLLAVDEPTNHLDAESRERVAGALAAYSGFGLLVSHDRDLLDRLCGACLFLETGRACLRPGTHSEGAREEAREHQTLLRQREKADRTVAGLREEAQQRRAQAALGEAKRSKRGLAPGDRDGRARVDARRVSDSGSGQRLRQLEGRLAQATATRDGLAIQRSHALGIALPSGPAPRPILLHLPEGSLALGPGRALVHPALVVRPGERIGIVGPNGSGKSSLLRALLAGCTLPEGAVAFIPQELDLAASRAVLRAFQGLPNRPRGQALSLVRRLGSDPARLLESDTPSPGELRKLLLATCVQSEPCLIVLDEPTNHLDLPSLACLQEALAPCGAALILVSHDRAFLGDLVRRQWHLHRQEAGTTTLQDLDWGDGGSS